MVINQRRDNQGPRSPSQPRPQGNQREVDGNRRPQRGPRPDRGPNQPNQGLPSSTSRSERRGAGSDPQQQRGPAPSRDRGEGRAAGGGQPQRGQQQRGQRRRRRSQGGGQQRQDQRPALPPSFFQRDLLLIPNPESLAKIQAVRTQFDPLALKVPPHITLLEPEPKANIQNDYLKKLNFETLPKLNELRFEKIVIHDEVFLWMIPSPESTELLRLWRDAVIQGLPQPGQAGEEFLPHISLGYLTRDLSAEETLKIAREKLEIPTTLVFTKLLLEEFGDNQVSVPIDSWAL